MNNPREIFTTMEDRWSWDKYIQQVDLIDLTAVEKQQAKDSIAYLRDILGEGFLRRAHQEPNPIFVWYFGNATPAARLSLIRLVESLKALRSSINFRSALKDIRRRLKTEEDYKRLTEKLLTVRVAHNFLTSGFEVEFDPVVTTVGKRGRRGSKKPDLKVVDRENKEEVIVEISRMRASDDQDLSSRTFHTIWQVLIDTGMHGDPEVFKDIIRPRYILPYAVIHRGIEDDELKPIVQEIRKRIECVRTSGEFDELIIPNTIEVGIASYENHHLAKQWAQQRGLDETDLVRGPDLLSDEITRSKLKLKTELKQIPFDKTGIVMLEAKENLLFFVYDLEAVANDLAEELKKYPQLLCLVFFHGFGGAGDNSYSTPIGPHTFVQHVRKDGSTQQLLLIRNVECRANFPDSTLEKLQRALTTPE